MLLTVINNLPPFVWFISPPLNLNPAMAASSGHADCGDEFHGQESLGSVPGAGIPLGQVMQTHPEGFGGQGNLDPREKSFNFHSLLMIFIPWNSAFLPFPR